MNEQTLERIERKLDRILAYIEKVESPQYQRAQAENEFNMNLLANAIIERLFMMFNNNRNNL